MNIIYSELFNELSSYLRENNPEQTKEITSTIKSFFSQKFQDYYVLPCDSSGEYLLDIIVTNFKPLSVLETRTLNVLPDRLDIFIAIESEIGGTGASSAFGVHKNVVEDFIKLLLVKSKYKVLIFTSLPYASETDHIKNRVENLRQVYCRTCKNKEGVLLVHLLGSQPNSSQVQASIAKIEGYLISGDGEQSEKIST